MTRVGSDIRFFGGSTMWGRGTDILENLHAQGLEGVNIRTMYELSPTLDHGELDDFRQAALDLDMYVEMGVGKINPYMTAELPAVRALGDGDYVGGHGADDRDSRGDGVDDPLDGVWGRQGLPCPLQHRPVPARGAVVAPAPRHDAPRRRHSSPCSATTGCTLAIETHEEITTFELVRPRRGTGGSRPSAICLDPGNLPARGELPDEGIGRVGAARRRVPSSGTSFSSPRENGVVRYLSPVGEGLVDWTQTLAVLLRHRPDLNLTIEAMGGSRGRMDVPFEDPLWLSGQPDFTEADGAGLRHLADQHLRRVRAGDAEPADELDRIDPDHRAAHDRFVARSARHLREVLASPQFRAATTMPKET